MKQIINDIRDCNVISKKKKSGKLNGIKAKDRALLKDRKLNNKIYYEVKFIMKSNSFPSERILNYKTRFLMACSPPATRPTTSKLVVLERVI